MYNIFQHIFALNIFGALICNNLVDGSLESLIKLSELYKCVSTISFSVYELPECAYIYYNDRITLI